MEAGWENPHTSPQKGEIPEGVLGRLQSEAANLAETTKFLEQRIRAVLRQEPEVASYASVHEVGESELAGVSASLHETHLYLQDIIRRVEL
jgi:hypothetical protein